LSVVRIHGIYIHRGRFAVKLMQGPSLAGAPSEALGRALAMRSHAHIGEERTSKNQQMTSIDVYSQ